MPRYAPVSWVWNAVEICSGWGLEGWLIRVGVLLFEILLEDGALLNQYLRFNRRADERQEQRVGCALVRMHLRHEEGAHEEGVRRQFHDTPFADGFGFGTRTARFDAGHAQACCFNLGPVCRVQS